MRHKTMNEALTMCKPCGELYDNCYCVWSYIRELENHLHARIDKIGSLIDVDKMERIVLDGLKLHASILKHETRVHDLETNIKELERFQEITHLQYKKTLVTHLKRLTNALCVMVLAVIKL